LFVDTFDASAVLSLPNFLESVLRQFDYQILSNLQSLSVGVNGEVFERHFQCEFYRCAISVLKGVCYCFPDVGKIYGSRGYLDFYVNSNYQWGVELVRNFDNLAGHAERFKQNGIYANIPMREWRLLHFVSSTCGKKSEPLIEGEWRVLHNPQIAEVKIEMLENGVQITKLLKL